MTDEALLAQYEADRGRSRPLTPSEEKTLLPALRERYEESLNPRPRQMCLTCGCKMRGEHIFRTQSLK